MQEYKKVNAWEKILRLLSLHENEIKNENLQLLAYSLMSFFIPMFLKHPQILVGAFVNMALVLAALNLRGKKSLPIIILPSLGAVVGGFLFGGLTVYLFYLIPFIWIGNTILVLSFKYFKLQKKKNFFLTLGIGSVLKAGFLFGITALLVSLSVLPQAFLLAMGTMQLLTALIGGSFAFTVQKLRI